MNCSLDFFHENIAKAMKNGAQYAAQRSLNSGVMGAQEMPQLPTTSVVKPCCKRLGFLPGWNTIASE